MAKQPNKQTNKPPRAAGGHLIKQLPDEDFPEQVDDDEDEDFDPASSLVEIVCLYQGGVTRFNIAGRKYKMRYGDVERIEGAYGTPIQVRPNTDPLPSVIERLTNRKILPVLDPRVDKDAEGYPLAARERRAQRQGPAPGAPPGA